MRRRSLAPLVIAVAAVAVAACSGGSGSSTAPSDAPSVSAPPASEAPPASPVPSASSASTRVDVVGRDYAYEGVEASYDGPATFAFRNEGEEIHEMVVVRKNDGVTESFEELLALPEDQSLAKVSIVGVAMAAQGETAPDFVTADQPGEYLMVCFIPQGTTAIPSQAPDASGPPEGLGDGPPHFTLGMQQTFTIAE
jgi:hypothetical protein